MNEHNLNWVLEQSVAMGHSGNLSRMVEHFFRSEGKTSELHQQDRKSDAFPFSFYKVILNNFN